MSEELRDLDAKPEKRTSSCRRDLNDIVRDESGRISGTKIGTICGQILAGKLLIEHSQYVIDRWDALAILLVAMTAPELLRKLLAMKYGNGDAKK